MSDGASREMTLTEWVTRLPECHRARKELTALESDKQEYGRRLVNVTTAAQNLRKAQKAYMQNRGNDEYGKKVAEAAEALDEVLALDGQCQGIEVAPGQYSGCIPGGGDCPKCGK